MWRKEIFNHTPHSLFISATGTGVGKTVVTAALAAVLRQKGVDCGVMKPIATGCIDGESGLVSEDALLLRELAGVGDPLDLINPVRFTAPLAPLVAARLEGREHEDLVSICAEAYFELARLHEVVLVEGIGGLLVPLQQQQGVVSDCTDLARMLGLPVVVVAARTLGTINHTLLTCRMPGVPFAGIVFNDALPVSPNDVAAATSPQVVAELTGLPVWGCLPFLPDMTRAAVEAAAALVVSNPAWP